MPDEGWIKPESECLVIRNLDQEDERLIIPLHIIHGIIINEVSCAVENGAASIKLNALKNMAGVTKNDVRTGIDQTMAKGNLVFPG